MLKESEQMDLDPIGEILCPNEYPRRNSCIKIKILETIRIV